MPERGILSTADAELETIRWEGSTSGLPILLLHEALGSAGGWRDFPAALARESGRTVVAWSRAGHGYSSALTTATSGLDYLDREAERLPAVLNALGFEQAHLFGHSDGATIALIAAYGSSQSVASLVLEAPHVMVEDMTLTGVAAAQHLYQFGDLAPKLARHHAAVDAIFQRWIGTWQDPRFREWSIRGRLADIVAPTLLIQGADDQYASMRQIEDIRSAIPGSGLVALSACGHVPHRERPEAVLSAAVQFYAARR